MPKIKVYSHFLSSSSFATSLGLVSCLAVGALLSSLAGQDISWDLRNYHLYNAISLIDRRIGLDFFAADKHSGLNPLLDLPYAYLALGPLAHWPRVLAALVGFWYGLLLFATWKMIQILFSSLEPNAKKFLGPLCFITAVTGGMALAQMSTTSNDVTEAFLLLTGLVLILKSSTQQPTSSRRRSVALAGLIFGMAAGAKVTSAAFAPAVVLALLISFPNREGMMASVFFFLSWIAGCVVTFGWWGWTLWKRFDNPFYPMLNAFFRSPSGPQLNLCDMRFFPRTIMQWIAYPFFWVTTKTNHLVYEFDFRDPRIAFAYGMSLIMGVLICFEWIRSKFTKKSPRLWSALSEQQKIVFIFFVGGYSVWLVTTSILRYAIVLEVLAIPLTISLLIVISKVYFNKIKLLGLFLLTILICTICLSFTFVPNWGHRRFGDTVFDVDLSWSKPDTLFLGIYEPVSFIAAFFPKNSGDQFMGLGFLDYVTGWPLEKEGRQIIDDHKGPIVVLFREEKRPFLGLLRKFGLSPAVENCRNLKANLVPPDEPPILACEVKRNVSF